MQVGIITKDYYYRVSSSYSDLTFCVIFKLNPVPYGSQNNMLSYSYCQVDTRFLLLQISLGLSIPEPINGKGIEILGLP